ncbi:uncharacterized protein LY89DRAFT_732919 [Mollisia scopiformis]|uniref:HIT-type domain-containing protein n=1 Tax=Mollisia scopiformis TaxID=149040 RepID=A0A194XDH9_MOLSC|nr:uncharacterized protein LY89DRAFT_732919 [Mollisia scopiformis]KUJ18235.1 hypothetical protein LY89DRAFT_732919 [Mollisia scopiformis]
MSIDSTNNGDAPKSSDEAATSKPQETIAAAEQPAPAMPASQPEQSSTEVNLPPTKKLCGVCNENEGKYKCSRCYLPYCSIPCSKNHTLNHPPSPPKSSPSPSPQPASLPHPTTNGRPGTTTAPTKTPFAALDTSPDLRLLFTHYPKLPTLLTRIHTTTLPPLSSYTSSGLPTTSNQKQTWTSDRGLQRGVEALKKARNEDGVDGESVREYGRVVLRILREEEEGGGGVTAEELVQREVREGEVGIVEMLLNGDIGLNT